MNGFFIRVITAIARHNDNIDIVIFFNDVGKFESIFAGQNDIGDNDFDRVGLQ